MKTSKVNWKVEKLSKMHRTKKVNFDLVIQRKDNIWDNKRQSTLIHSILSEYPIPSLFAVKEESIYQFLDGKQRLSSIFDFIDDKYTLHLTISPIGEEVIAGLKFSELPQDMQTSIMNYELDIVRIEDIQQKEMEELFFRLNNGVPLRQIETTRAILGTRVLKFVESIADLDFFSTKANLSKSSRKRFVDQELVLQILALVNNNQTGFSGKELQAFVQDLRNVEIQDSLRLKMQNACYYLSEAFPKKEKFLKKLHVPMLFKLVLDLIKKGELAKVTPKEFGTWASDFFSELPEAYAEACQSSSARKENVQKRLSVMYSHFNQFVENKALQDESNEGFTHLKQLVEQEAEKDTKAV